MLTLRAVTKKFGDIPAVSGVSFDVGPGEVFSLIGPNGSGKTTIIRMIAGLLRPTEGSIEVAGHDTGEEPIEAKKVIGYVPDEPSVWSSMTGEEFLHLSGALFNISEIEREKNIKTLLSLFDLEDIRNSIFEDYSRGNKQKFTILAALLHKPKVLLVDEPIVGLDPTSAEIAKNIFSSYAKKGGSVLLATHTLSVAQEISHRIGVLKKGVLVASGTLDELRVRAGLSGSASLGDIYKALAE
jgi:ABC-2 type transport system ATP-binding protein